MLPVIIVLFVFCLDREIHPPELRHYCLFAANHVVQVNALSIVHNVSSRFHCPIHSTYSGEADENCRCKYICFPLTGVSIPSP